MTKPPKNYVYGRLYERRSKERRMKTEYDEIKNQEVIGVAARASFELAGLFGFEVDYGDDEMLALQEAIYGIFGKQIAEATLNTEFAAILVTREQSLKKLSAKAT